MANIGEKAISTLVGNLNSGLSYLITTVSPQLLLHNRSHAELVSWLLMSSNQNLATFQNFSMSFQWKRQNWQTLVGPWIVWTVVNRRVNTLTHPAIQFGKLFSSFALFSLYFLTLRIYISMTTLLTHTVTHSTRQFL